MSRLAGERVDNSWPFSRFVTGGGVGVVGSCCFGLLVRRATFHCRLLSVADMDAVQRVSAQIPLVQLIIRPRQRKKNLPKNYRKGIQLA